MELKAHTDFLALTPEDIGVIVFGRNEKTRSADSTLLQCCFEI